MKKAGIAVAVVVALGLAGTAGAWYTGTQMEGVLRDAVARSNAQIDEAMPGGAVRLEMTAFERGVFSSSARYELTYPGGEDEGPVTLTILDNLEHGPFPLSRLASLQLLPVMATSEAVLERSETLEPLFAASGDEPPIVVSSTLGYTNNIDGSLRVAPLAFENEKVSAELAPVMLEFATDVDGDAIVMNGQWDGVRMASQPGLEESFTLQVSGVTLFTDQQRGSAGIYLGEGRLAVASIRVEDETEGALVLEGLSQNTVLAEEDGNLTGDVDFGLSKVSYKDQELGSAEMQWSFSQLDQEATAEISRLYNELTMSVYAGEEPPEQGDRWREAFIAMLDAQPQLALDLLVIRTPNGESRARAEVQLAKPESFDLPAPELVPQLLSRIDAHVQVSTPMLRDMVMYKTLAQPDLDPEVVAIEAEVLVDMLAGMAQSTGLAKLQDGDLVTNLIYADGGIELNGEVIPPEALAGVLALLSPASPASPGAAQEE